MGGSASLGFSLAKWRRQTKRALALAWQRQFRTRYSISRLTTSHERMTSRSRHRSVVRLASSRASHAELRNRWLRFCFSRLASHDRIRPKSEADHCAGTRIRAKCDMSAGITGHLKRRNSNEKRTHPDHDLPVVHRRHPLRPDRKPAAYEGQHPLLLHRRQPDSPGWTVLRALRYP